MSSDTLFTVHVEDTGGILRGTVGGELDMLTEPDLIAAFGQAIDTTSATSIVLDLRQISFIDSSGLRGVLLCNERAVDRGIPFALVVDTGPVTRLLDLAGVRSWFSYG